MATFVPSTKSLRERHLDRIERYRNPHCSTTPGDWEGLLHTCRWHDQEDVRAGKQYPETMEAAFMRVADERGVKFDPEGNYLSGGIPQR